MTTHVHPATSKELEAAVAGELTEVWMPFEKQPIRTPNGWSLSTRIYNGSLVWAFSWDDAADCPLPESNSPIQPGDTVVLGEEWWKHGELMCLEFPKHYADLGVVWGQQLACTMPAELGRFRYTAGESTPKQDADGKWGWVVKLTRKEN